MAGDAEGSLGEDQRGVGFARHCSLMLLIEEIMLFTTRVILSGSPIDYLTLRKHAGLQTGHPDRKC